MWDFIDLHNVVCKLYTSFHFYDSDIQTIRYEIALDEKTKSI